MKDPLNPTESELEWISDSDPLAGYEPESDDIQAWDFCQFKLKRLSPTYNDDIETTPAKRHARPKNVAKDATKESLATPLEINDAAEDMALDIDALHDSVSQQYAP